MRMIGFAALVNSKRTVLYGKLKKTTLTYPNEIKMLRHKKIKIDQNPYDNHDRPYFEEREKKGVKMNLPSSKQP